MFNTWWRDYHRQTHTHTNKQYTYFIYIYMWGERERNNSCFYHYHISYNNIVLCVYIYIYGVYIYIYIEVISIHIMIYCIHWPMAIPQQLPDGRWQSTSNLQGCHCTFGAEVSRAWGSVKTWKWGPQPRKPLLSCLRGPITTKIWIFSIFYFLRLDI